MYNYNEVYEESLKYFDDDELAAKVFTDKYALRNNDGDFLEKTPSDMHMRLAKEFNRIEEIKFKDTNVKPYSVEEIYDFFDNFNHIIPQGSPMFGIGNEHQLVSSSNCFVLTSPDDSYGSILSTDEELVQISKRRGGVGIDLSHLRPNNSPTNNSSRTSTGVITFMDRYSHSINEVGQGSRRGALMLTLDVHHPDILGFINAKKDLTKVTGANISVRFSDEFLNAVENYEMYEQRFPVDYREKGQEPKISKMVKAREVWDEVVKMAHASAEPGILFWGNIIRNSPADSYADLGFKTVSTNPCAELPLSILDSCRLIVLNLYTFVKNPFTSEAYFNYTEYEKYVRIAQRFMDDLIDLEIEAIDRIIKKIDSDPESIGIKSNELNLWYKIKNNAIRGRRTGLGITALGDTIAALNIGYATDESIVVTENIYKTLKLGSYRESVELAKILGPFPIWNYELEKDNEFLLRIKDDDESLYNDMKIYGRRNIACNTTAPSGSVSILCRTSSGCEPVFMMSYTRRKKINAGDDSNNKVDFVDKLGVKWQEFKVYHPKVKEWMKITGKTNIEESPWFGYCAEDLNWKKRVELQARAQFHVDHSLSSTLNLPEDVTIEQVDEIYRTAWKSGCKGLTIYRKNCRSGVLVDTKDIKKDNSSNVAIKRPKVLQGDVHHFTIKGKDYYVSIGLFDEKPYEIFVGENHKNEEVDNDVKYRIPKKIKKGLIEKVKRGYYDLITENEGTFRLSGNVDNAEVDGLTRMISTSLRHQIPLEFVVQQLEKTKGFDNFPKSMSRSLKKYINEGTKVTGEECPSCNSSDLVRQDGCVTCKSCGYSKCS